jgi:hypothetical protein
MHRHQEIAAEFLREWFGTDERFALLVRVPDKARTVQRILLISDLLKSNYLGWLAFENRGGANVYFSINPLIPGAAQRTKGAVSEAKGLYLDLDSDGDAKLAAIHRADCAPPPTAVIQTSAGKYQLLWRVRGFSIPAQEATLKTLAYTFGGDRAFTDSARVFRLPGFFNRKYTPAYLVTVEMGCKQTIYSPADFRLEVPSGSTDEPSTVPQSRPHGSRTQSEADWRWVMAQLRAGNSADEVVRTLAASRHDKPNPLYYAQRTVNVASAVILARMGIDGKTIVNRLAEHRSTCTGSRPTEIAATALRFVERFRIHHSKEN